MCLLDFSKEKKTRGDPEKMCLIDDFSKRKMTRGVCLLDNFSKKKTRSGQEK